MKSALKLCIVNRVNRKNIYSKNDAIIYIKSYSDLLDTRKYAQLDYWSLVQTIKICVIGRRDIVLSPNLFKFPSLSNTYEVYTPHTVIPKMNSSPLLEGDPKRTTLKNLVQWMCTAYTSFIVDGCLGEDSIDIKPTHRSHNQENDKEIEQEIILNYS